MSSLERKDRHWQTVKQSITKESSIFQNIEETKIFPSDLSKIIGDYAYEKLLLFAVGGYDGLSYLNTMERFDLAKNVWEEMPEMRSKRNYLGVVAI